MNKEGITQKRKHDEKMLRWMMKRQTNNEQYAMIIRHSAPGCK